MNKLKGILLTQGMHGMISQVEGLAKALDIDFTHHIVELNNFWKMIPPKFTPISQMVYKKVNQSDFDMVISCGRKSVIPSIHLKNSLKKKVISIHIQDPKVNLKNFNYVIAPEHDELIGENVFSTKGAIHYLTKEEINNHTNYLQDRLLPGKKYFLLILGGPTKHYDYSDRNILNIFNLFNNLVEKNNLQGIIVPSMRTPKKIIDLAKSYFDKNQIIITEVDKKAYLSSLRLADYIVVTCDSTSMISEAAITGKPIYVAQFPTIRNNPRFKKFFKLFESLNIIRDLKPVEIMLDRWNYEKLNETDRISSYIKEKLNNYDFS